METIMAYIQSFLDAVQQFLLAIGIEVDFSQWFGGAEESESESE